MRIAVLSDIHGNLPALQAVLRDLESQAPDEVWCGGDLAWNGPWGPQCIETVRAAGWTTVRGNTDVWITGDAQTIESPEQRRDMENFAAAHNISPDDASWLLSLPLGHSGPGSVLLVHGTPESPFTGPLPDASAAEFAPFEGQAGVIIYGHVHHAFTRRLADGTLVCNAGSVGLPKDGVTACYLLIDSAGADLTLRHRRVWFDPDNTVAEARRLGGPVAESFIATLQDRL